MTDPDDRPSRRSRLQRLVLGLNCALVVTLLATAGGLAYVYSKYSQLPRVQLGSVLTERGSAGGPQNFLLVGVDSATSLAPDDPARSGRDDRSALRSDTMMVLRVDPGAGRASLLSLPRDLWVPLASGGNQRLNTAIQVGGASELIATIARYLGVPINHYIQVDFAGFQRLVDVVHGVKVYFDHPARDTRSGLDISAAGCVRLEGDQALAYVRSRHYQRFENGRWRTDPSADLGRISRQQDFIVRALRRSVDEGVRNPVILDRLVNAALDTVAVDDLLTADDIITLGRAFRGFDPGALDLYSLPVTDDVVGGADVLRLLDAEAQPTLERFRGTTSGAVGPGDIRVTVLNGSGITGQASQISDALATVGFGAAGVGEAERFDVTVARVRYVAGDEAQADLVARYLEPAPLVEQVDGPLPADVEVVTGTQPTQVRPSPRAASPSTSTPSTTTTTSTIIGSSTSTSSTTSTTAIGYVPQAPPGVTC